MYDESTKDFNSSVKWGWWTDLFKLNGQRKVQNWIS